MYKKILKLIEENKAEIETLWKSIEEGGEHFENQAPVRATIETLEVTVRSLEKVIPDESSTQEITLDEKWIEKEWNELYLDNGEPAWAELSPKERNDYRFGGKLQDVIRELKEDNKKDLDLNIEFKLERE